MKKNIFLLLFSILLSACNDSENIFFTDDKCNGIPILFDRYVVDSKRQRVLLQVGSVYGTELKEERAMYLDSCEVTDNKNFICKVTSLNFEVAISNGTLIRTKNGNIENNEDCTYKKGIWGYKKIADAIVKDTTTLPSQNK